MTRRFNEGQHTLLVAACAVAGAIVMTCSPPLAAESAPRAQWTDGCVLTAPLIEAAETSFQRGWTYPQAKAFAASDRRLSGQARWLLLGYIKARYDNPAATATDFLETALDTCSALDRTGSVGEADLPYFGVERWISEGRI